MAAATYDLSAVVALGAAAYEQHRKGRYARAAEKWERAVEAARALNAPDCLVLADTQVGFSHAADDARFKLAMDLVHAAADVLERRRIAGTLLYGKCAPHEVEWRRQFLKAAGCGANVAVLKAPYVGYEAYLKAARLTIGGFTALYGNRPPTEQVTPPYISLVAFALDLVCEPRPHDRLELPIEAVFVEEVCCCCLDLSWLSRSHREVLLAAWGRLQASGVIQRRKLERLFESIECKANEADAKAQADASALGLRSCAYCGAKEVHVAQFKRCATCKDKGALYCSKECQRTAWPAHKAACKAARKAAAGAAGDA